MASSPSRNRLIIHRKPCFNDGCKENNIYSSIIIEMIAPCQLSRPFIQNISTMESMSMSFYPNTRTPSASTASTASEARNPHAEPAQQPGGSQRSHRRRPWTASRATSIGAEKLRLRGVRCGAKGVFQGETDLACSPQWLVLGRRRSSEKKLKNVGGGGGKLYVRL